MNYSPKVILKKALSLRKICFVSYVNRRPLFVFADIRNEGQVFGSPRSNPPTAERPYHGRPFKVLWS